MTDPVPPTPREPDLDDYDYMIASVIDMAVEEVSYEAVMSLTCVAENAQQFFAGMQATIELGEIVDDYYAKEDPTKKGPR